MKKILLSLLAIVALLLMIAWIAGLFDKKIQPDINTLEQTNLGDPVVVVVSEVTIIEKVPASVEATQATMISSRLMARISTVRVRAGDVVSKGDLLLELENQDIKARVQQAEARIRGTSARLKEARQNLDRVTELQAGGVMSIADLDKAQANHEALLADMAGANQALEEASTALGYTKIVAPFDGRVVDRFAEPGDTAQPGTKLLALYNPLSLRVEAQVRENLALGLEVGQPLQVEIPSLDKVVDAVIEERVPAAEPGSRSFLVKAGVAFDKNMLPGMYARLLVPAGVGKQLLIPADRVVHVGQLDLVWVLQDGQSYRRFVRIGQFVQDGQVEVISGLDEGDMVLPLP
ncbi:MAG: efflux RND transporter periplasmic adaptor subunit [Gammaproteobacteria bacterium]|nr:efflux RND transporter periplasmic adaptor subunit [Gammaproteobacteria bacterium]